MELFYNPPSMYRFRVEVRFSLVLKRVFLTMPSGICLRCSMSVWRERNPSASDGNWSRFLYLCSHSLYTKTAILDILEYTGTIRLCAYLFCFYVDQVVICNVASLNAAAAGRVVAGEMPTIDLSASEEQLVPGAVCSGHYKQASDLFPRRVQCSAWTVIGCKRMPVRF